MKKKTKKRITEQPRKKRPAKQTGVIPKENGSDRLLVQVPISSSLVTQVLNCGRCGAAKPFTASTPDAIKELAFKTACDLCGKVQWE